MKKCDHYKELVLTDYIDGELDQQLTRDMESHLLDCRDCRVFFKEVKNNAAVFLLSCSANVLCEPVPPELWDAIKQNIEDKGRTASPLAGIIDQLKGLMVFPRMVPLFASLMLMFLAGTVALNNIHIQQAKDKDQGEYLVSLLGSGDSTASDNNDGRTPIESYFL